MNMSCNFDEFYCISYSIDKINKNLLKLNIPAHSTLELPIWIPTLFFTSVRKQTNPWIEKNLTNQLRTDFTQHGVQGYAHFQKCIEKVWIESKNCTTLIQKYTKIEVDMSQISTKTDKLETLRTDLQKCNIFIRKEIKTLQC